MSIFISFRFYKNRYLILGTLVLLYLFSRITVLLWAGDILYDGEETYVGVITHAIISGSRSLNLLDYQMAAHWGGCVFNAILAIPFFLALGPSIFSLKLVTVFICSLSMIFLFLIMERYFNLRTSVITCLFYICSAPVFTIMSVNACGSHTETCFFSMVALYLLYKILYNSPKNRYYIFLGLLSGFSLWYQHINSITIIGYLYFWFIKDKTFFLKKKFSGYAVAFIAGLSPWFIYSGKHGFTGLDFVKNAFIPVKAAFFANHVEKFYRLITLDPGEMFGFRDFFAIPAVVLNYTFFFCAALSFIILIYGNITAILKKKIFVNLHDDFRIKQEVQFSLLLLLCLFIFLYVFSSFKWGSVPEGGALKFRYLAYTGPFISAILGIFVSNCIESKTHRRKGIFFFISVLFICVVGNISILKLNSSYKFFISKPGYNYIGYGRAIYRGRSFGDADINKIFDKLRDAVRIREAYNGYAQELMSQTKDISFGLKLGNQIKENVYRQGYFEGLGRSCFRRYKDISLCAKQSFSSKEMKKHFMLGAILEVFLYDERTLFQYKNEILPALLNTDYYSSALIIYGAGLYKCLDYNVKKCIAEIESMDRQERLFCILGLGFDFANMVSADMQELSKIFACFPDDFIPGLYQGLGAYFYVASGFDTIKCKQEILKNIEKEYVDFCLKGIAFAQDYI